MSTIGIFLRWFELSMPIAEVAEPGCRFLRGGHPIIHGLQGQWIRWTGRGPRTSLRARVIEDGTVALNKSGKNVSISYSNICP